MKSNNNWQIQNLKDICTSIIRGPFGSSLKKEFFITKNSMSYKVYEQKNAIHSNAFIGTYYISKDKFQKLKRFEVKANDIIMSCSGTIGKLYTIPENAESGIINQALLKFTLNNKLITNSFFLYYLKTIVDNIEKKGSGIQNIGSVNLIKKLKIPIPPIYIQEQIVKELDTLCDIITKKKEQLAELDKLAQATFYDMFGDPIKNEKRWVNKKLSEVCHFVGGGTPPKANQNYYQGAIPWATVRDMSSFYLKNTEFKINEEAIKKSATNIIPKGSIIIATRVGLGKVCLLKQDTAINQDLKGVIPNEELNNIYLGYWFKEMADEIIANGEGATVKGVTLKFIHNLNIFLPPILFQTQFAEKIEAIDQQKALINQSIADVQLLFNYTMDKYFN